MTIDEIRPMRLEEMAERLKNGVKIMKEWELMINMSSNDFNKSMVLFDENSQSGIFKLSKEQIDYIKNVLDSYLDLQLALICYDVKNVGELEEYTTKLEHKLLYIKDNINAINNCLKEKE